MKDIKVTDKRCIAARMLTHFVETKKVVWERQS